MKAYIDVRGVWPVYIKGLLAFQLRGFKRDVTIQLAELWIAQTAIWDADV